MKSLLSRLSVEGDEIGGENTRRAGAGPSKQLEGATRNKHILQGALFWLISFESSTTLAAAQRMDAAPITQVTSQFSESRI